MNNELRSGQKMSQRAFVYSMHVNAPLSEEKKRVLDLVGHGRRVLEIGAHNGGFTRILRANECAVTAVEIDEVAGEKLAEIANEYVIGDIEDPAVLDRIRGTFDVILLMHVLEHTVNPWSVLRSLREKLAHGGEIVVLLPNIATWTSRKTIFFEGAFEYSEIGLMDRTHLRFFTFSSGRALVEKSGYRVLVQTGIDLCAPLERRMRRTPLLKLFAPRWKRFAAKRWPNLCFDIMLIHATVEDSNG